MPVRGHADKLPSAVLQGHEGLCDAGGAADEPASSSGRGTVHALVSESKEFPGKWEQVYEPTAAASGVADQPGPAAGGKMTESHRNSGV